MNQILNKIDSIAGNIAESYGFFVVDINIRGDKNKRIIEVFVDGESSVTAEDLAGISRSIVKELETDSEFNFPYRLDVSSPGTDRPLKYLKQYKKHINRKFDLNVRLSGEVKSLKGKLTGIDGDSLHFLSEDKKEITLNFDEIIKAKVIISFS